MRPFKSKFVLASILAMLSLLVAACGSSSTSGGTGSGAYSFTYNPTKPAPQTGGTVITGDWQPQTTVNVLTTSSVSDVELISTLWSTCLAQLPDLSLGNAGFKLDQCDTMPTSTNSGKTITMHFPADSKYSNGKPITAADYAFYTEMLADPNIGGGSSPFDQIQDIKVTDPQTLVLDFKIGVAPYLAVAAGIQPLPLYEFPGIYNPTTGKYSSDAAQNIVSAANFTTDTKAYNGPFMLQEFTSQDEIVVKNPNYTSGYFTHPANLDKIIFRPATDKDVLIQAYKSGQYTDAQDFSEADLLKFTGINAKEVISTPLAEYEHFDFNQRPDSLSAKHNKGVSIFGGPNGKIVRQAFSEAIDRCKLLSGILGEDCKAPNTVTNALTAPPAFDYDATVPAVPYNPTEAASLLDQAGYKLSGGVRNFADGTPLTVELRTTTGNAVRLSFLTLACQQISSALNVKCNAQGVPHLFSFYNKGGVLSTSSYDMSLFAFENTSDPYSGFGNYASTQIPSATNIAGQNFEGVNDPSLDQMFNTALSELNPQTRVQDYKNIQLYFHDNYVSYPLYIRKDISLHQTTAGNYFQGSYSEGNFWNASDWYTTKSAAS